MVYTPRTRNRTSIISGGSAYWPGDLLGPVASSHSENESMNDVIGDYGNPHPLYHKNHSSLYWILSGYSNPGHTTWNYHDFHVAYTWSKGHIPTSAGVPSDNTVLSQALARTNPNRSYVDVPLFLFELREIPKLVLNLTRGGVSKFGSRPIRKIADRDLNFEYGVGQYLKDLQRMLDFQAKVEQRLRQLRNLQSSKNGGRTSSTIWSDTVFENTYYTYATNLYSESNIIEHRWGTERKKWASTQWKPTIDLSSYDEPGLLNLARRAVFGYDISFDTIYQGMPWTWLLDWFSNAGDIFSLSRNTIPVVHDGSCVMYQTSTGIKACRVYSGPGSSGNVLRVRGNAHVLLEQWRTVMFAGPTLEFSLPFLNDKQLSTLSSLALQRFF